MKRLRAILLILGSMVIISLLIACGSSIQPTPTTVTHPADQSEVPHISAEELKKRLDNGDDILVIDTRNSTIYDLKHIPRAIMKPDSFDEVAHDQEIIAYCSCPNESESASLALRLYGDGYTNVSVLLGGWNSWESAGYPLEGSRAN